MDRSRIDVGALRTVWLREGWVHLPGFFDLGDVAAINDLVDALWVEKPASVTVDDVDGGRRCRMSQLVSTDRSKRIKINDLYLVSSRVRSVLLNPSLCEIVAELLSEEPVLCNSLNLEKSSAQDYHADSLFMTPRTPGRLAASWIALEDVLPGAGPLRLYPASHLIPRFVFSGGSFHARNEEMARCGAYFQEELDSRSSRPRSIYARTGDLVIWHADLLHGAEPIADFTLTRKSMVAHYFGLTDCFRGGYKINGSEGARWLRRRAQPTSFGTRLLSAVETRIQTIRRVARSFSATA